MPDHTNDLRAHALHQKSKEPPEVPRITWQQAAVLRLAHLDIGDRAMIEADLELQGFLAASDPDGELGEMLSLGRAALAAFDAERVREIRKPLVDLLDDIYDRLEDYVDVVDGEDRPSPNFAMSIRTSIDVALGRQP